jgi:hypothetical protein
MTVIMTKRKADALKSVERDSRWLTDSACHDRIAEATAKDEREFEAVRRAARNYLWWDKFRNRVGR